MEQFPTPGQIEERLKRVRDSMADGMRNDPRFRALVDSCVVMARDEYGRVDPDDADRAAYEQATFAAAMLLARVYDEDGEMAMLRAERDAYRDKVLKFTNLYANPVVVQS